MSLGIVAFCIQATFGSCVDSSTVLTTITAIIIRKRKPLEKYEIISSFRTFSKTVEIYTLQVAKEDIKVHFYEERDGVLTWEAFADFQPSQVHKQTAIWFRPPRYHKLDITEPVRVSIQLQRPTDGATSEPLPFEYLPLDSGRPALWSIRRNLAKKGSLFSTILANETRLLGKRQLLPFAQNQPPFTQQPSPKELITVSTNTAFSLHKTKSIQTDNDDALAIIPIREAPQQEPVQSDVMDVQVEALSEYSQINKASDAFKSDNVEEKTFNEIIKQVVELDEIYADTQARLAALNDDEPIANRGESFDDAKTYSSLQMAFKNPLQICEIAEKYEDVNVDRSSSKDFDSEKLPPLPPKRIRRANELPSLSRYVTDIDTPASNLELSSNEPTLSPIAADRYSSLQRPRSHNDLTTAPVKKLPPAPCSTLPNPKKRGFFSKIFAKKQKSQSNEALQSSTRNSLSNSSKSLLQPVATPTNLSRSPSNVSANSVRIPLKDSPPPESALGHELELELNKVNNNQDDNANLNKEDINLNLDVDMAFDLTEAEHYALYTAIAPHATQSEFDEASCYYAPVEGGKILTDTDDFFRLNGNKT